MRAALLPAILLAHYSRAARAAPGTTDVPLLGELAAPSAIQAPSPGPAPAPPAPAAVLQTVPQSGKSARSDAVDGERDVIVQMFQWTWDGIARECEDFLGPAGYGWVQASPAQERIVGSQWWTSYQPVSYNLTTSQGTRAEYKDMIDRCHKSGVKVIADVIWNHMTASDTTNISADGTKFSHYAYPSMYTLDNFHHCGLTPGDDITNYTNRVEVQTCELTNLADLATDTEYVRARLAQYGNDLMSLGVDGMRLDASKHMPADDIKNITSRLTGTPYLTQEVIWGPDEPIQPNEYEEIGDVQEFRYTGTLKAAFLGAGTSLSELEKLPMDGWVNNANVFVANHDTEREQTSLSYKNKTLYTLATVFSLAHPYGRPTVLSGYQFDDVDAGAPSENRGTCDGEDGVNGWLCQHRWPAVKGLTGFRNVVGSAPLTMWASPSAQRAAFGRGSVGFVALNNEDSPWSGTFATSMPAGTYCDVVAGPMSDGKCKGGTVTVDQAGNFVSTVIPRSALAVHAQAIAPAQAAKSSASRSALGVSSFLLAAAAFVAIWL